MVYLRKSGQTALGTRLTCPCFPAVINGAVKAFNFLYDVIHPASWMLAILAEFEQALCDETVARQGRARESLVTAWKDGRLLGMRIEVTSQLAQMQRDYEVSVLDADATADKGVADTFTSYFLVPHNRDAQHFVLPCFVIVGEPGSHLIEDIWVAPHLRRLGIGRCLCELHHRDYTRATQTPGVFEFWHAVGFTETATPPHMRARKHPASPPRAPRESCPPGPPRTPGPRTPGPCPRTPGPRTPGPPRSPDVPLRNSAVFKTRCFRGPFRNRKWTAKNDEEHVDHMLHNLESDLRRVFFCSTKTEFNKKVVLKMLKQHLTKNPDHKSQQVALLPQDPDVIPSVCNSVIVLNHVRCALNTLFRNGDIDAFKKLTQDHAKKSASNKTTTARGVHFSQKNVEGDESH